MYKFVWCTTLQIKGFFLLPCFPQSEVHQHQRFMDLHISSTTFIKDVCGFPNALFLSVPIEKHQRRLLYSLRRHIAGPAGVRRARETLFWLQTKYQYSERTPGWELVSFCSQPVSVWIPLWILPFPSYRGCVLWKMEYNLQSSVPGLRAICCIGSSVGYFVAAAVAVNSLRKALKQGRVHWDSQFRDRVHHDREVVVARGSWSHGNHSQEAGSRPLWLAMLRSFSTFLFLAAWVPGPGNGDAPS